MSHERDIDAADWTDQDLLTREEAGDRLAEAIESTRRRLEELEARPQEGPETAAAVRMVRRRLAALESRRDSL
jgi:hypothetical protein